MDLLNLKSLGNDVFTGEFNHLFFGHIFGGHVLALGVKAALMTIDNRDEYLIHSVHNYFLYSVSKGEISYTVRRTKDGRGFCFRDVTATQNNKTVFTCLVSFKSIKDQLSVDLPHCIHSMPSVPPPEDSVSIAKLSNVFVNGVNKENIPLEIRFSEFNEWDIKKKKDVQPVPVEPKHHVWIKTLSRMENTTENDHRLAIVLASDYAIPALVIKKYPHFKYSCILSMDHCIHFHANHIDFNEWCLFDHECAFSGHDGVTFNIARIYSQDGTLVASTNQQGLVRAKL